MHPMCIELEYGECDQNDLDDDVQVERDGVLLEEVDMVVMVIIDENEADCVDEECVMEGLEDFLAGLETAQRHITDVGANGEAEADAQVAGFRVTRGQKITIEPVVPMDHRMGMIAPLSKCRQPKCSQRLCGSRSM